MQRHIYKKWRAFFDCDMCKRCLLLFAVMLFAGVNAIYAQQSAMGHVSGVVTETDGKTPVIGATVYVPSTAAGTITNEKGEFELSVPVSSEISVSYVGYETKSLVYNNETYLKIALDQDNIKMEDVVVVGYGTQRKETVVGAVTTMQAQDIVQTPVANLSNALNGRLPGVVTMQRSGQPGEDDTEIYIRGIATLGDSDSAQPLILVDGVERSFSQIDANEIETITVLKDASATAVYGVRGANGVILVTTRRGEEGRAKVGFTYQYGVQVPTSFPTMLDATAYSTLYQEAIFNDTRTSNGFGSVSYTESEMDAINRVATGAYSTLYEQLMYPNTNFAETLVADYAPQMQANVNVSGGTKSIRYFASVGYLYQGSIFEEDDLNQYVTGAEKTYSTAYTMDRYNFRTNFDIDVAKNLLLKFNLGGVVKTTNQPSRASAYQLMHQSVYQRTPMDAFYYEGQGWPANGGVQNIVAYYVQGGFAQTTSSNIESTAILEYDASDFVKGLKLHANVSFDSYFQYKKSYNETPEIYDLDLSYDEPEYITKVEYVPLSLNSASYYNTNKLYMEFGANYTKTIGDHSLTGLLLYNQQQYTEGADIPYVYMGAVGRGTYAYKNRYLAEFNIGYNGSENFAPGNRFGVFPAFSAGWVISEESFLKDNVDWISWLKLRASYGEVGNDQIGSDRFLYYSDYNQYTPDTNVNATTFLFGTSYYAADMIAEGQVGNMEVTWERAKKANIGLDVNLFDNKLSIVTDYFFEKRDGILIDQSSSTPTMLGADLPAVNKGITKNHGFEIEATYRGKIGDDFNYWVKGNYCFARNEIVDIDEAESTPYWQSQEGYSIGQPMLYECIGLFQSYEDIAAYPDQSAVASPYGPGDRIYADYNGDGVVDSFDAHRTDASMGVYGQVPEITYGANLGIMYKGFDFSILVNGVAHISVSLSNQAIIEFDDNVQDFHVERWSPFATEEANANATFPALHITNGGVNKVSSYGECGSMKRADYLRLKNVEFGYTLPQRWTDAVNMSSVRVYANGNNLCLLYDALKILDPESASGTSGLFYPQMKVFNIGLNIKF